MICNSCGIDDIHAFGVIEMRDCGKFFNYFAKYDIIHLKRWYEYQESKLRTQSMDFAVSIINLVKYLKDKRESIISNQIGRSGTSIGANLREAQYARGKPDFIAKMQVALKECYETEYWLELFVKSDILSRETAVELYDQCGTIRRILIASINTANENAK